jgi:ABC-type sugar transport system substrate-binding protein
MVMFSAHIEYGVRERYRALFGEYHSIQANWDPNKQIQDIHTLLSRGIDLLVIDALVDKVVARGIEEAMEAGVPVIVVAHSVPTSRFLTRLDLAAEEQGQLCAQWLADTAPPGSVVFLTSSTGMDSGASWLRGAQAQWAKYPSAEEPSLLRTAWSVEASHQIMSDWLAASGSVNGMMVNNGLLARGAAQAFVDRGMSVPPIAGADDWNGWLRFAAEHAVAFTGFTGGANLGLHCVSLAKRILSGETVASHETFGFQVLDSGSLPQYYRSDLTDDYWGVHDLPETWIERMFRL